MQISKMGFTLCELSKNIADTMFDLLNGLIDSPELPFTIGFNITVYENQICFVLHSINIIIVPHLSSPELYH